MTEPHCALSMIKIDFAANPDIIARMACLQVRIFMSGNRSTMGYDVKSVRFS